MVEVKKRKLFTAKVAAQSKPGLRNTHFVTARKSTRQVMAGKEAGKIDRGPDQRSQFI